MDQPSKKPSPPPVTQRNLRPLLLILSAVIVALLLLVVVMQIDRPQEESIAQTHREIDEDLVPSNLTQEEIEKGYNPDVREEITQVDLREGGWIEIADPEDPEQRIQRYQFKRMDPYPEELGPGWYEMTDPIMEIFLSDDRLLTVAGTLAYVSAPNRALEEGTIEGDVLIKLFENSSSRDFDVTREEPLLIIQTPEASFNNIHGTIRCSQELLMETESMEFPGHNLRLQINDQDESVALRIEKVDYIRLVSPPEAAQQEEQPVTESDTPPEAVTESPTTQRQSKSRPSKKQATQTVSTPDSDQDQDDQPARKTQFYRMILKDNVHITQGTSPVRRVATGDELHVIFSSGSDQWTEARRPTGSISESIPHPAQTTLHPLPPPVLLSSLAIAHFSEQPTPNLLLAPPPQDSDTIITCDGDLELLLIRDPETQLPDPGEVRVELLGLTRPVELTDEETEMQATFDRMLYEHHRQFIELIGSDEYPLTIVSPEMTINTDRFWTRRDTRTGGFIGAGTLVAHDPEDHTIDTMQIKWQNHVDLTFHPSESDAEASMGHLRTARFNDDVVLTSKEFQVDSEQLEIELPPRGENTAQITAVRAFEQVHIVSTTDFSNLHCDEFELTFDPEEVDDPVPQQMQAWGRVVASDNEQTIESHYLLAIFAPLTKQVTDSSDPSQQKYRPELEVITLQARDDVIVHLADNSRVFADDLLYDQIAGYMELTGENVMMVSDKLLADRGHRITFHESQNHARWEGRGRARSYDNPVGDDLASLPEPDLQLTWMDGVDFDLTPPHPPPTQTHAATASSEPTSSTDTLENLHLQRATFHGSVDVQTKDLWLDSDHLALNFPEESLESDASSEEPLESIESIHAYSNVHVGSHDEGTMSCNDLLLTMTRNESGETVPKHMLATGQVMASDPNQIVWADEVETFFHTDVETAEDGSDIEQVERVIARGNVEVSLTEGGRAYSEELLGDPARETITLTGHNVIVVKDEVFIDDATSVTFDGKTQNALWNGTGHARIYPQLIEPVADGRIDQPSPASIELQPQIDVNWTESMLFDSQINDGAGQLTFQGNVDAISIPSTLERNTMSGQSLILDFELVPDEENAFSIHSETDQSSPDTGLIQMDQRSRRLHTMTAQGDAKIESHSWIYEDHHDAPRIFYIAGPYIRYNDKTSSAQVIGEGTLLVRDTAEKQSDSQDTTDSSVMFAPNGISRFRWTDQLHLTSSLTNRYTVHITGNVRAEHQSPTDEVSTMRSDWLDANFVQMVDEIEPEADDDPYRFGGSWKLRRVTGGGNVVILTPTRDVRSDHFNYNLTTRIAEMRAEPGRRVSVITRGSGHPIQAEYILWNMERDTITITRGSGTGG